MLVFVDGQNAYKACERLFGHGPVHPLLLAHRLAGQRRLTGVRYYSGVHDPNINARGRSYTDRRHALMRRVGVTVVERMLRYRWEWGFDASGLPDPRREQGASRTVEVTPYQRPREKGIDLAMGLDVIDLAVQDKMDVAVIVSSDNDLCEAARATHTATKAAGRRVSVEAALFHAGKKAVLLRHYDFTHQLRRADFDATRDDFDYRAPLDRTLVKAFASACDPYRGHLGDGA